MSTPNTNPLSYNGYVQNIGVMAVVKTALVSGVYEFSDPAVQTILPQMLNYAELRIQRDLDLLPAQTSNIYTMTAGVNVFPLPVDDFLTVQTLETVQTADGTTTGTVVQSSPLLPTSKEYIQNVYGDMVSSASPQYFAMYGDTFGNGGDVNNNILFGPSPNFGYLIRVTGTIRTPSLYTYGTNGPADTQYTYISAYYPDLLMMASMVYVSAFQRNFSATADDAQMSMSYEKQYLSLMTVAKMEENRKKGEGSGWSAYSTPTSATPTR